MNRFVSLLVTVVLGTAMAEGPRYDTMDGCDEARWKEWESIIISFEGYPEEQEDARHVRELNRKACADWKSGNQTAEQATQNYDKEVEAWVGRVQKRQERRRSNGMTSGQG